MGDGSNERHSVRWHRLNAGLTIDALALRAQISRGTTVRIERGFRSTLFGHIAERTIAEVLGVNPEAIAWGPVEDEGPTLNLAELRNERGLQVSEVALRSGVGVRTVLRAEQGIPIAVRHAKALADFYGVRVTDFYPVERRGSRRSVA